MKKKQKVGIWILSGIAGVVAMFALLAWGAVLYTIKNAAKIPLHDPMTDEARLVHPIAVYHSQNEVSPDVYRMYLLAADLPVTNEQALTYYRVAALMGYAPAQNALGERFEFAEKPDMSKAAQQYKKAAERGFGPAQGRLALCYLLGEGVAADAAEAEKWMLAGEQQGCAEALLARGASLLLQENAGRDEAAAKLFDALTQHYDKQLFINLFTQVNEATVKALQEGAKKGNPADEAALGLMCALGVEGAPAMDPREILQMLRHAMGPSDDATKKRAPLLNLADCSKESAAAWLQRPANDTPRVSKPQPDHDVTKE